MVEQRESFMLATPVEEDFDVLAVLWEDSVRASHAFLGEDDIASLRPLVREQYLPAAKLLGARDTNGKWLAFMGTKDEELEALFVRADVHRRGVGRALAEHAIRELGVTRVDVNEQNPGATEFYKRLGFVVVGRSPVDGQGRPFPILHMQLSSRS